MAGMAGIKKQHFSLKSPSRYLLSTYCVPGAVLQAGETQGPGSPCWEFQPQAAMGSCLWDEPEQELQEPFMSQVRHSLAWLHAQWPPPYVVSDCCPPVPLLHHLSWRPGLFQSF